MTRCWKEETRLHREMWHINFIMLALETRYLFWLATFSWLNAQSLFHNLVIYKWSSLWPLHWSRLSMAACLWSKLDYNAH
mmetsp:Transcript_20314/g.81160  ORF Transcript_20314/g.81160 Transcript_20314/m.81160 type:complete len:80 (-) Transcript_20314:1010-1249(-)